MLALISFHGVHKNRGQLQDPLLRLNIVRLPKLSPSFLMSKIGYSSSSTPIVWCDNLSATYLTTTPIFHSRSKHLEIDFHFVRDKVQQKELQVRYLSIHDQLADILTKPLSKSKFFHFRDKLTVLSRPPQLEGG